MYHHRPAVRHHRRKGGYFLPFLSIILIGLIVILAFQIVGYFIDKNVKAFEDKVAVNVIAGKADIKIWGVDQWTAAIDGTVLTEGDALRTSPGSRVELMFLNGSVIRMDADSQIEFLELQSREANDMARVALRNGQVWVRSNGDNTIHSVINIETENLRAKGFNTIYGVSKQSADSVHVLDGVMQVEVLDTENSEKVLEVVEVEFGQEVMLTDSRLQAVQQRRPAQLVGLLQDEYRDSEWYRWNRSRDTTGADSVTVVEAVQQKNQDEERTARPLASEGGSELEPTERQQAFIQQEAAPVEVVAEFPSPVVSSPELLNFTTQNGTVTILGSTHRDTQSLEVTPRQGTNQDPYILNRYSPGQIQWSYVASLGYGNLVNGENRFSIVAIGRNGQRSEPTELKFTHNTSLPPADLSAPVVLKILEESEGSYLVTGTIGQGIARVVVNGFALTRFVANSKQWSYRAAPKYGNLTSGLNTFEVYGEDIAGKKTPIETFTIEYKPPAKVEEATVPEESGNSVDAGTADVSI